MFNFALQSEYQIQLDRLLKVVESQKQELKATHDIISSLRMITKHHEDRKLIAVIINDPQIEQAKPITREEWDLWSGADLN